MLLIGGGKGGGVVVGFLRVHINYTILTLSPHPLMLNTQCRDLVGNHNGVGAGLGGPKR